MNSIESPKSFDAVGTGYFQAAINYENSSDGYGWLIMNRSESHYFIWPKAQLSDGYGIYPIWEGGDPGDIVLRVIRVNSANNQILIDAFVNNKEARINDFENLFSIYLIKTGVRQDTPIINL